jgi:hypothetical protein
MHPDAFHIKAQWPRPSRHDIIFGMRHEKFDLINPKEKYDAFDAANFVAAIHGR